jgi:hypothetical protein
MASSSRRDDYFVLTEQDDDDLLLDWDLYARNRRQKRFLGFQVPEWNAPAWWYRLSSRQRKIARFSCSVCTAITLIIIIISISTKWGSPSATSEVSRDDANGGIQQPPAQGNQSSTEQDITQPELSPLTGSDAANSSSLIPTAASVDSCDWNSNRLPQHIIPKHYNLTLDFDDSLSQVNGSMLMHLSADKESNCIVLHADPSISISVVQILSPGDPLPGADPAIFVFI